MPEHLTAPLTLTGGRFVTAEQDTLDELRSNVFVICAFPVGSRDEDPDFGIEDPALTEFPLDTADIEAAIAAYEPRAEATVTATPYDPRDPGAARVRVVVDMPEQEDELP